MKLQDLLSSFSAVAIEAQEALVQKANERKAELYDPVEDNEGNIIFIPKSNKRKIANSIIDVPHITQIPDSEIVMDTLELELETEVALEGEDIGAGLKNGMSATNSHVKIKMSFSSKDLNEGAASLQDSLINKLKQDLTGNN